MFELVPWRVVTYGHERVSCLKPGSQSWRIFDVNLEAGSSDTALSSNRESAHGVTAVFN